MLTLSFLLCLDLPISCEYMDRDSVDIIDRSGRILTYMIRILGTGHMMGYLWGVKTAIEGLPFSFAPIICDKLLHTFNNWIPSAIPKKFIELGREYDHNCLVAVGEFGDGTLDRFIARFDTFVKKYNDKQLKLGGKVISYAETGSDSEVNALNAFRFGAGMLVLLYYEALLMIHNFHTFLAFPFSSCI